MSRIDDEEKSWERESRKEKAEADKQQAIKNYGEDLGKIFFDYSCNQSNIEQRERFAEVVVKIFENGTSQEKVKAVMALLESFDIKTEELDERVSATESNTRLY